MEIPWDQGITPFSIEIQPFGFRERRVLISATFAQSFPIVDNPSLSQSDADNPQSKLLHLNSPKASLPVPTGDYLESEKGLPNRASRQPLGQSRLRLIPELSPYLDDLREILPMGPINPVGAMTPTSFSSERGM
jgi:hypothetical protein